MLSALQPPIDIVWIFIIFVIFAIVYYILIQQEHEGNLLINVFAVFCAICFSAILAYNLGYSLGIVVGIQYHQFALATTGLYYLLILVILYKALAKGKWFQKPLPSEKKEKIDTEAGWGKHPSFMEFKKK